MTNQVVLGLRVKRIHPDAILPTRATDGSACFDLRAIIEDRSEVHVFDGYPVSFETGLAFEIPEGYAMMIYSRSGAGFKSDVRLSNCVGVIDSDYREGVMVKLARDGFRDGRPFTVKHGDRIAQAMLIPVPRVELVEVEELSTSARTGGFGSTGTA
jgi:dUTP pyrophosphatase